MKLPAICGIIDRRILVNYRVDPDQLARLLPEPFRPKVVHDVGMVGICLIRLTNVRPSFAPRRLGISSENAAHRTAVEWDDNGITREGVYIFRRDTSSRLNSLAGDRLFPGIQHHARFTVSETEDCCSVALRSDDGATQVAVRGRPSDQWPTSSTFRSLDEASAFFEAGSVGFSPTRTPGRFQGMELECSNWRVDVMAIDEVLSSFFEDESRFPHGSIEFDCALLMRGIEHQWHDTPDICCPSGNNTSLGSRIETHSE